MQYDQLVKRVQAAAGIDSRNATERAVVATLKTLALRLEGGEASDLAAQLPEELAQHIRGAATAQESFGLQDFFQRVASEEGVADAAEAERHARAVTGVLAEAITQGELEDVFSQLPSEYVELFAPRSM